MTEDEGRQAGRHKLWVYFDVTSGNAARQRGYLADVSATGLMFVTQSEFEPGSHVSLRIDVSPEQSDPGVIDALVEVIWTGENVDPQLHCVGCRFLSVDPGNLKQLLALAETFSFGPEFEVSRVRGSA